MFAFIIGNQNPVVGKAYAYELSSALLSIFGENIQYEWYIFKKQKNGSWRDITGTPKVGRSVTYAFHEPVLGNEFELRVFETKKDPFTGAAKKQIAILDLVPSSSKAPQIDKVILFNRGSKDVNKAGYRDTLVAQAFCTAMFNQEVEFQLWEDDAAGGGHNPAINKNNRSPRSYKSRVNEKGIAEVKIPLSADERILKQIANKYRMKGDQNEEKNHEYYVTATFHGKMQRGSQINVDVANPDYKKGSPKSLPQVPAKPNTTSQPQKPKPKENTPKFPATKASTTPKQADAQARITDAYFVNNAGQRLTKAVVGDKVQVRIHTSNMIGKHVQYVVWEYDPLSSDEVYRSGRLEVKGDNITTGGFTITKDIFKEGADIGDSEKQNYFIEILPLDVSAYSKRFGVDPDGLMEVEKVKSAAMVKGVDKQDSPQKEKEKCPRCEEKFTLKQIEDYFGVLASAKIYRTEVIQYLNQYIEQRKSTNNPIHINTCLRKAHFFAQVGAETLGINPDWIVETDVVQYKVGNITTGLFGERATKLKKSGKLEGYCNERPQKKLLNFLYAAENGFGNGNGNEASGDGYKFRGRGLKQLTGRGNYKAASETLKEIFPDEYIDLEANPDKVKEVKYAVLSALAYWEKHEIWKTADTIKDSTEENIKKIRRKVNGGTAGWKDAKKYFEKGIEVFQVNKCEPVKIGSQESNGKWRLPIDNPMLCMYSQGGGHKPWHGSFGEKIRDESVNHTGNDLLAEPGTKVYACLKGKISKIYTSTSMAGNVVVIKVLDTETFKTLKNAGYVPKYKDKGELLQKSFDEDGSIYLTFWHLSKNNFFKVGDEVNYDDVIGLSGISGWNGKNFTTQNPHLHFEVSNVGSAPGLVGKCNPSVYFKFKTEDELSPSEIAYQNKLKEIEWK